LPGWYEGYCIRKSSQSNGLEGSHKDIKQFEGIKARSHTIKFLRSKGTHLVEEWYKIRSPEFSRSDGTTIPYKIVKLNKNSYIYFLSDSMKNLERRQCLEYQNFINNIEAETSFKNLIETSHSA